jgi:hypothetical protein
MARYQTNGSDQRTGFELIKGIGEDGFSFQEVKLFLLPFHEAKSLASGDDYCVGFHCSIVKKTPHPAPLPSGERDGLPAGRQG